MTDLATAALSAAGALAALALTLDLCAIILGGAAGAMLCTGLLCRRPWALTARDLWQVMAHEPMPLNHFTASCGYAGVPRALPALARASTWCENVAGDVYPLRIRAWRKRQLFRGGIALSRAYAHAGTLALWIGALWSHVHDCWTCRPTFAESQDSALDRLDAPIATAETPVGPSDDDQLFWLAMFGPQRPPNPRLN